jgi:glycosyltransferase involved in cell wall biosynthesis
VTEDGIKILFMQSQEYAGPDSQIQASLMTHLPRSRFEVHCAVPAARGGAMSQPARNVHELSGVHVRPTRFGPSLEPGWRSKVGALYSVPAAAVSLAGLAAYIRKHRIDVVHCTEKPRDAFYGTLLAKAAGAASVIHLHIKPDTWMRSVVRRSMHHADALVGVSEFVARSTVDLGYAPDTVFAVPNGLELSAWLDVPGDDVEADEVRREFGADPGAPLLVSASRLFRWKGQHLAIEALPTVKARFPNVMLLIVGHDDIRAAAGSSYTAELRRMVGELDLTANVVFTGWRADIKRLMAAADVFVLPSFEEPFGMVYLEAMALQRPIVALDNGGAREIIDHERSGLLAPPDDAAAIAANIVRLFADPQLRRRMGEHGRRRVIERFSSVRMATDMAAVYERIVADRRRSGSTPASLERSQRGSRGYTPTSPAPRDEVDLL